MTIKPVDNVYFGAYLPQKQKDRNMEAKEAFEIVLELAKRNSIRFHASRPLGPNIKEQEALAIAEAYTVYWRDKDPATGCDYGIEG